MLGDRQKVETARQISGRLIFTRVCISLDSEPIFPDSPLPTVENGLMFTDFVYSIEYLPSFLISRQDKPFLLQADLFPDKPGFIRFKDYEDLVEQAKTNKALAFIMKYTNISQEFIDITGRVVKKHFPLSFDIIRYVKDVEEKITPENKGSVLVSEELNKLEKEMRAQYTQYKKETFGINASIRNKEKKKNAHN